LSQVNNPPPAPPDIRGGVISPSDVGGIKGGKGEYKRNKLQYKLAIALFTLSLTLYSLTLAPSVVTLFDDSLEFQLVTYQLGIAHPTGYPLYTLLGKLFTFMPIGNIAFRVNFMSAFFAALTVAWLYLLIMEYIPSPLPLSHENPPSPLPLSQWERGNDTNHPSPIGRGAGVRASAALAAAALFAVSPIFWQQATIAEVYSLNSWFVVVILWLAISPYKVKNLIRAKLLSVAALLGLALTHHRTAILLVPPLALYFLILPSTRQALKNPRLWLELVGMGSLPLLLYLYLPLRGHVGSLDGSYQNTWAGFWQQVTASGYGSAFLLNNPFNQNRPMSFYPELLYQQFGMLTWLGFLGAAYLLWQRRYANVLLTGLTLLTYTMFNLLYHVADIEVFFIPVFLIWASWIGLGFMAIGQGVNFIVTKSHYKVSNLIMANVIITPLILWLIISAQLYQSAQTTLPILQTRNTWHVHDYGLDLLQQPLPDQATVIGIVGEITLMRYFQQTVGLRPDLQTITADAEPTRWVALESTLAKQPTAYLTQQAALLPGLPQRWSLSAIGPLVEVRGQPLYELPPQALNQAVTPAINLVQYHVSRLPHTGAGIAPIRLTVTWQATQYITINLQISARLLNPAGEVVAVMDTIPVHFAYPTTAWRVGEMVTDVYDLSVTTPGSYTPLLIWYDPANNAAEVGRVILPSIK